jgi:hypothetical protein
MLARRRAVAATATAAIFLLTTSCSVHHGRGSSITRADKAVNINADNDRGVTKNTIRIGAVVYRDNSFSQFGLASITGKRAEDILKPFVDDLNEHGGIAGRRVSIAVSQFSPLVPAEQQTACVDQATDEKVFVTVAPVFFSNDGERCLASNNTPVVTSNASSLAELRANQGWVHQIAMAKDRVAKNWIDWLVDSGTATPASKIGLVHGGTPEDNALTSNIVVPYLRERGLNVVSQVAFTGTTVDTVTAEAQNAALQFKHAGIDLVLPNLDFLRFFVLIGAIDSASLHPHYSVSDLGQLAIDATTSFYPDTFNGTQAVSANRQIPAADECVQIYQAHGQHLSTDSTMRLVETLELAQYCEQLRLIARVAELAGPHLNRASFVGAFAKLNGWSDRVTLTGPLTFGPGKFDGPDDYAVRSWLSACSCYHQVAAMKKGRW